MGGEDAKQRQEAISTLTLCREKHIPFGFSLAYVIRRSTLFQPKCSLENSNFH